MAGRAGWGRVWGKGCWPSGAWWGVGWRALQGRVGQDRGVGWQGCRNKLGGGGSSREKMIVGRGNSKNDREKIPLCQKHPVFQVRIACQSCVCQ